MVLYKSRRESTTVPFKPTRSPAKRVRVGEEEQRSGADARLQAGEAERSMLRRRVPCKL